MAVPVSRKGIIPINNKQTNKTTSDSFSQLAEREENANIPNSSSSSFFFFFFFFFFFLHSRVMVLLVIPYFDP